MQLGGTRVEMCVLTSNVLSLAFVQTFPNPDNRNRLKFRETGLHIWK
jgi:hypothetical protein